MRIWLASVAVAALGGCAMTWQQSQDYVAGQSNFDVCRLTMGGPHSQMAQHEATNRGLDCTQYYGAIAAQQANRNAAVDSYLRSLRPQAPPPRPINCTSQRVGNTVQTDCY